MHFTIITPSLNYGRFLADCLASVAAQWDPKERRNPDACTSRLGKSREAQPGWPQGNVSADDHVETMRGTLPGSLAVHGQCEADFAPPCVTLEHLVIDGGSTDESAEVAARFPHLTWLCEPDEGMSDAINKGFDRARGEWVMWLNADDRLTPGALAKMLPLLEKSTADVVYGDWNFVDESGVYLRHVKSPKWSMLVHVHHHCYVGSTAAFYRRETVIASGHRLRNDFHYVMDGEFYARLDALGKRFAHVPVTVADFRLHGANASQRHLANDGDMETLLAAERQHVESRAIRRAYGVTLFSDPYLNGLIDGLLWIAAKAWKGILKLQLP